MPKIEIKERPFQTPVMFYGDMALSRVFMGISPAFSIVVGQEQLLHPSPGKPAVHVLAEAEETELGRLLEATAELVGEFHVSQLFGNMYDEGFRDFVGHWNSERREKRLSEIHITRAPKLRPDGNISWHVRLLIERLRPEAKSVFLLKYGRLSGYMSRLPLGEIPTATDKKYPQIGALGLVVAACELLELDIEPVRLRRHVDNRYVEPDGDYDPLNYCNREDY